MVIFLCFYLNNLVWYEEKDISSSSIGCHYILSLWKSVYAFLFLLYLVLV